MPVSFITLLLFVLPSEDPFPQANFIHLCWWNEVVKLGLATGAQLSLISLEGLLYKSAPIVNYLFPNYAPLVSVLILACANLTPRIPSLIVPNQPRSGTRASATPF